MAVLPPDPLFCLKSDMGHIHSLCFPEITNANYTNQLLASNEAGYVYFWNLETNRLQHKQLMGESIQAIHHTINGELITQEKNGLVKLWQRNNSTDYRLNKQYHCNGGFCRSILINNNLIVPQENSTLDIVNIETMECIKHLKPYDQYGHVMCLQLININNHFYILCGYESGDILLWDYEQTNKQCGHIKLREYITSLTFDPIQYRGICGNSSNLLQIFTINKQFEIELKCELSIINNGCSIVRLRQDRRIFVSGGWDGRIRVFSWKSLRLLVVLNEHKGTITDVQWSPKLVPYWDTTVMAASGSDGTISLWSLYN